MTKSGYISYSDQRFNYPYKGFCSIVCGIIDMAMEHYIVNDNFNVKVGESQTLRFFDNTFQDNTELYDVGSWWLERYFSNQLHQSEYNAHTVANLDNLKFKNIVFTNILKIKTEYLEKFDSKVKELGIDDNTLGVQIRGTDKKDELPEIQIDRVISLIDQNLKEKIFVATDDKRYLDKLLDRYGDKIIYDKSISISTDNQPLHHNCENRDKINEEVLSNVYLLSKCKNFLYSLSNVSLLSLIMGSNNFQSINCINQ